MDWDFSLDRPDATFSINETRIRSLAHKPKVADRHTYALKGPAALCLPVELPPAPLLLGGT